ncbi:MAG: hypothetical protein ACKVX9_04065 [Blastocatellia bacterium]
MKGEVNTYAKAYTAKSYPTTLTGSGVAWRKMPRIPNFVWLAMIIVAITALSYSAYNRSRQQEEEARASYNETAMRVENARVTNRRIREQTDRIRRNPAASAEKAREQMRLLRRNEIVVSIR